MYLQKAVIAIEIALLYQEIKKNIISSLAINGGSR
jgi:hypothetical protein